MMFFFSGGYGFVFIAQDTASGKDYALKVWIVILFNKNKPLQDQFIIMWVFFTHGILAETGGI